MVPTATRQPESHGALAAKGKLVRKGYQKLGDLTEDYYHKVTNRTDWCTERTSSVHSMALREETEQANS